MINDASNIRDLGFEGMKAYPKNKLICEPQMGKRGLYPTLSAGNLNKLTLSDMDFSAVLQGMVQMH